MSQAATLQPEAAVAVPAPHPARAPRGRLEFLDALRGVAALAVAVQHITEALSPAYLRWSAEVFRPGEFGVFLFFLCSGFIIPTSLEKYGDLRRFWIARFFRLFPLYWFCLLVLVLLGLVFGVYRMPDGLGTTGLLLNFTMIQDFVGQPNVIGAAWTLAFEMCFYLACSVLFLAGMQRRPVQIAVLLLGMGAVGIISVPPLLITGPAHRSMGLVQTLLAIVAFSCFVTCIAGRRSWQARVGMVALSALMVPLVLNRKEDWWFAMIMFGTMFTGTVLYRWHQRQQSGGVALGVALLAVLAWLAASVVNVPDVIDPTVANARHSWRPEVLTYAAALATFGLALALRRRSFPRALLYLGTISYSVYLVHASVILIVPQLPNPVMTGFTWMLVVLAVSSITHRTIEKPFQDLGRRLIRGLSVRSDSGARPWVSAASQPGRRQVGDPWS